MKVVLGILLVLMAIDPIKIGKINSIKAEARKAYVEGDYKKAAQRYRYLTDTLAVNEDEVKLNLANSYFQMKDTANAMTSYQSLTGSAKPQIRSRAQQQLGVMNNQSGKLEEALANFKQAIKADPSNMDARYNYEILKKKLDDKKKQDEQNQQNRDKQNQEQQQKDQQQNKDQKQKEQEQKDQQKKEQEQKDQQKKDQQKKEQEQKEQEQKDQQEKDKDEKSKDQKEKEAKEQDSKEQKEEQEKKERAQQLSQRLQQMKISEEKAKMILEAMKNQEVQYLQQNKRKATKQKDKAKPDW